MLVGQTWTSGAVDSPEREPGSGGGVPHRQGPSVPGRKEIIEQMVLT